METYGGTVQVYDAMVEPMLCNCHRCHELIRCSNCIRVMFWEVFESYKFNFHEKCFYAHCTLPDQDGFLSSRPIFDLFDDKNMYFDDLTVKSVEDALRRFGKLANSETFEDDADEDPLTPKSAAIRRLQEQMAQVNDILLRHKLR